MLVVDHLLRSLFVDHCWIWLDDDLLGRKMDNLRSLLVDYLLLTLLRGVVVDLLHVLVARIWRWRTAHALKKELGEYFSR